MKTQSLSSRPSNTQTFPELLEPPLKGLYKNRQKANPNIWAYRLCSVTTAGDTLSHVETMSVVKGPGPAGVPSLFLPANENESRKPHCVSSPLLSNAGDSPPAHQQFTSPLRKVHSWGVALLQNTHTHTPSPYYAAHKHTQHKCSLVMGRQGGCQKARVVGRGS